MTQLPVNIRIIEEKNLCGEELGTNLNLFGVNTGLSFLQSYLDWLLVSFLCQLWFNSSAAPIDGLALPALRPQS